MSALRALTRDQLPRTTVELAIYLLGRVIVRETDEGRTSGRIVETEAYLADDPASHSFRGRSKRNGSMFLERGHSYVYFIYGMQYCLNVTSEDEGTGAAVLLRALEPLEGIELMHRRRGQAGRLPPILGSVDTSASMRVAERDLTRGPGRLVQALGVGPADDGADLCAGAGLYLACDETAVAMGQSARIGITKAADRPLRFFVPGNVNVSGPRALSRRGEDV